MLGRTVYGVSEAYIYLFPLLTDIIGRGKSYLMAIHGSKVRVGQLYNSSIDRIGCASFTLLDSELQQE